MVILDIKDYIDEDNRQFNNTSNYEQLDFDPTELHTDKIKSEIINLKNSLLEEKIETPEFHLLPKIHKANNPGRPVISSINYHTSRISEFVDCYLQPDVKKIISYVKDTPDFIKKIETIDHLSDNSYLVSLDVCSLYTNIPHKEGIETVKQKLRKSKPDISIKSIFTFLKPILTLNNFVFNGINYLQRKSCAMGTKCVPSYANIFMGWFEEEFIFPLLTNVNDFYLSFKDNIFLIWNGTKTEFNDFFKKINQCHPSIKFEYKMSKIEISFLYTTVFNVDNKLRTKVYGKPTNRQSYLHSKSDYPNSTKKCIAYSHRSDLLNNCKRLLNTLTKRGYNKKYTTTQINRTISVPRNELLNKIKTSNTEYLPDFKTIIGKNRHILQIKPKLKETFAEPPILAFKRNKNPKDIIEGNKIFDNKKKI